MEMEVRRQVQFSDNISFETGCAVLISQYQRKNRLYLKPAIKHYIDSEHNTKDGASFFDSLTGTIAIRIDHAILKTKKFQPKADGLPCRLCSFPSRHDAIKAGC